MRLLACFCSLNETLRCAQGDKVYECHSERSEESPSLCQSAKSSISFKNALTHILLTFILVSSLLAACQRQPSAETDVFQVTSVIDGDTIVVAGGMRLRYIGMNAPELSEPLGEAAKEANRNLVEGKRVRLEKDILDTDRYGRWLRYVYVDGLMVNKELVRLGLAKSRAYPPDIKYQDELNRVEQEARRAGRGIWSK